MKQYIFRGTLVAVCLLSLGSCGDEYNDNALWDAMQDRDRISALEAWSVAVNGNIAALAILTTAVENDDFVTGVTAFASPEPGYYIITLTSGASATIQNGRAAPSGYVDASEAVPHIGVKKDNSGGYYWTFNGDFLQDDAGKNIPVSVETVPRLRLDYESNFWQIKRGTIWVPLNVKTTVPHGNPIFARDGIDNSSSDLVVFTLADNKTKISLTKYKPFAFEQPPMFSPGFNHTITYNASGHSIVAIKMIDLPLDWTSQVNLSTQEIIVAAPAFAAITADNVSGEAMVLAIDTKGAVVMRALSLSVLSSLGEVVLVEGGTFLMGATAEQPSDEVVDNEKPVHEVTLDNYYIAKHEVTQKLWHDVMGEWPTDDGLSFHAPQENSKGDNYPIGAVTLNNAQNFITKLNAKTGMTYRLPTEAEWEYAARGGKKSKNYVYSGGNDINNVAWYDLNSGERAQRDSGHAFPVGTKQPNELGIYDMSGNVHELVNDWYSNYTSAAQTNPTGPSSVPDSVSFVVRGGSWYAGPTYCRVSRRGNNPNMSTHYTNVGFRLVLNVK
ncbi:hypothetical protein AGMMS4957_21020 [Bacteroidia bacterium]|nr:hypothetical protein AGMMS4957_21020 [Bacteroidia bacterium]